MDEVIGAQIVSVPMSLPLNIADETFQLLSKWLAGAFLGISLVGNLAAVVAVPRRPSEPAKRVQFGASRSI